MTRWFGIPDTSRIHLATLELTPDAIGNLPLLAQMLTMLATECEKGEHLTASKFDIARVGDGLRLIAAEEDVHTFVTGSDA